MLTKTRYAFSPSPMPILPVEGLDEFFPARHVWCVGRNYADHAREMGSDPVRESPFFFSKPADALVPVVPNAAAQIHYPRRTENFQHEVELVVALNRGGSNIAPERAREHIYGYAIGIDLTRRDVQLALRDKGRPWEMGKAFDHSAPVGPVHPAVLIGHPDHGAIWLEVNGERRQQGDVAQMIWSVPEIIAELSSYVDLCAGDLIFTGTPAGVGPLRVGDSIRAGIAGLSEIALGVVA
jgi:fumarylpyruvate hydrolase